LNAYLYRAADGSDIRRAIFVLSANDVMPVAASRSRGVDAEHSSDGARPVIGPYITKRPDARARETRLYKGVFGRVPATFKTNVVGFSKIAAKVSGVAWVTTLIPVRAGGFA
jgi:hypothetical protein